MLGSIGKSNNVFLHMLRHPAGDLMQTFQWGKKKRKSKNSHLTFDLYQKNQQCQSRETIWAPGLTQPRLTRVSLRIEAVPALWNLRIFPKIQVHAQVVTRYTHTILLSSVWFFLLVHSFFFMARTARQAGRWDPRCAWDKQRATEWMCPET